MGKKEGSDIDTDGGGVRVKVHGDKGGVRAKVDGDRGGVRVKVDGDRGGVRTKVATGPLAKDFRTFLVPGPNAARTEANG